MESFPIAPAEHPLPAEKAGSILEALIYALPEQTNLREFLTELGFSPHFDDLTDEDESEIGEAYANGANICEIMEKFDVAARTPKGYFFVVGYESEDGPILLSVKPESDNVAWMATHAPEVIAQLAREVNTPVSMGNPGDFVRVGSRYIRRDGILSIEPKQFGVSQNVGKAVQDYEVIIEGDRYSWYNESFQIGTVWGAEVVLRSLVQLSYSEEHSVSASEVVRVYGDDARELLQALGFTHKEPARVVDPRSPDQIALLPGKRLVMRPAKQASSIDDLSY